MLDRITSIEAFLAVARHGSFARGASELGLSRAMVSKHIKALETQLGVRLFNRSTRSIHLTEAGAAYRDRIAPFLEALADIESSVGDIAGTMRGTLAVAAPTSFGLSHVSPRIAAFMARYPEIRVRLMLTDRTVDLIDEGFDCAIVIRELVDSNLVARLLGRADMRTCAAPGYLEARGRPRVPEDLRRHNCLVFSELVHRDHAQWTYATGADTRTVRVGGDFVSNLGDALKTAALAGRGIVRLPAYLVDDDIAAGRLEPVLGDFAAQRRPIYACYPHREFLASKVRVFVEFLLESFA